MPDVKLRNVLNKTPYPLTNRPRGAGLDAACPRSQFPRELTRSRRHDHRNHVPAEFRPVLGNQPAPGAGPH